MVRLNEIKLIDQWLKNECHKIRWICDWMQPIYHILNRPEYAITAFVKIIQFRFVLTRGKPATKLKRIYKLRCRHAQLFPLPAMGGGGKNTISIWFRFFYFH